MKRIGVSELRKVNADYLRKMKEPVEICSKNQPLKVLIPFEQYLKMQELILNKNKD